MVSRGLRRLIMGMWWAIGSSVAHSQVAALHGGDCSECCPDGHPKLAADGGMRRLASFTPSPADVTVCPDGHAYLTLDGQDEVWRIVESQQPERFASVAGVQPAGVACDERGRLFVAGFSVRSSSPYTAPLLLMIEASGGTPVALPQPARAAFATPNGVAFVPGAGVYVTDTLSGVIVRVHEVNGAFESVVVARNLLGVNGIAYDPHSRQLFVSNSLTQEVSSLLIEADGGLAAPRREWTSKEFLPMLDGLAVDEHGKVYVANYQLGTVLRLPEEDVVGKVANPASLAFRGTELLIVDYHLNQPALEGGLYAAASGACGAQLFPDRR